MQIKQRLRINSAGIAFLVLAIITVLSLMITRVNGALEASRLSKAIFISSYERLLLRTDSHRTGSERTKVQLIAKHKEVGNLLKAALQKFPKPEDQKTLRELLATHESIGFLSRTIRERREKRRLDPRPDPLFEESENLLLSQLNTKVYESVLLQAKLHDSGEKAVQSSLRLAASTILLVLLLVSSVVFVSSIVINRLFAARMKSMRDGTAVIGGGALDHRIQVEGDDEFSELARAFNEMTGKLRGSYHVLQDEIEERKRVEIALRESEEQLDIERGKLETIIRTLPVGIVLADAQGNPVSMNRAALKLHGFDSDEQMLTTLEQYPQIIELRDLEGEPIPFDQWPGMKASRGEVVEGEDLLLRNRRTGLGRIVTVSIIPVKDSAGQPVFLACLLQDITDHKRGEQELKASLHEKEVLLKEVHHRVKNNLQVISSLMSLQACGSGDETVRQVLSEVSYRVRSMALVHEKLYQSADLARIDFADYLRSLLAYIWRAHGSAADPVRLTLELEPVSLPVDIAVPCGLIVNELAGNALKHAFQGREEGEVTVSLRSVSGDSFRLQVADNGVGFPEGVQWQHTTSLGLRLVQMLAGQLEAGVEARSGPGTSFDLTVKSRQGMCGSGKA